MKLQIEAGERAGVQFTTRPFTSGSLAVYDERGVLLMSILVDTDQERTRVEVSPVSSNSSPLVYSIPQAPK